VAASSGVPVSTATASPSSAAVVADSRPTTRLQRGITKQKYILMVLFVGACQLLQLQKNHSRSMMLS
jgi:hypothetical protein